LIIVIVGGVEIGLGLGFLPLFFSGIIIILTEKLNI